MLIKYLAFLFQVVLPVAIVICIAYLTNVPVSEWGWSEYSIATPLIGFTVMTATLAIWRVTSWLYNLALNRHSNSS